MSIGDVGQDDFGLASVGTKFGRPCDTDEGFRTWVGFDQTDCVEFAIVGEGVSDLQSMEEIRHIVVHIGQRNGQLVEGVVDVVVDGEVVAALHHGVAFGAALGAGDAEGEALFQRGEVGAVGQRLREVDLQGVVIVDPVGIPLWPGDIDALVGSARLHITNNLGGVRVVGGYVDVAH